MIFCLETFVRNLAVCELRENVIQAKMHFKGLVLTKAALSR